MSLCPTTGPLPFGRPKDSSVFSSFLLLLLLTLAPSTTNTAR